MNPKNKKILKRVGIVIGVLVLLVIAFGIYVNSIIPKFNSVPIVLQSELTTKPAQLLPMEGKYIYKSASALAAMVRNKQATSVEIVTEFINNIKNNNYKYNALIWLREQEALADAARADEMVTKGDTLNKPLLGVPITFKEMFWVKGSPSTLNAKMFGFIAPRNAIVVNQLKDAGAVILGTTNVPYMLSDYQTQGEVYPVANNPFDVSRTPGGSTGGGAAALAAGFTTLELGSDLGGSIRIPAVFCGLWSLKPTIGAINLTDGTSPDTTLVYNRMALASAGPLARTPDDLRLVWNVLRKTKIDERFQKPITWNEPTNKRLDQYKFASIDEWQVKDGVVKMGNDVKLKLRDLIDSMLHHNANITKDAPDMYQDLQNMFMSSFGSMLGENQPWLLRKFIELDFKKTDDGSGEFASFSDAIMDASDEGWQKIEKDRKVLIDKWESFFDKYDFFICPVSYGPAFKKQESWKPVPADDGTVISYVKYMPYSSIINATGHPAITVPLGLNAQGLPIGIQIVGRYYSDPELLHLAKLLEPLTPGFQKPK